MVKPNIRKVCSGRDQRVPPPNDKANLPYDVKKIKIMYFKFTL